MHQLHRSRRKGAFTLIELLVVILILAILASLIVPRVVGRTDDAKRAKAATDISQLSNLLQQFRMDNDRFPSTEEGLDALRTAPADASNWRGPYSTKAIPLDPWGSPYEYELINDDEYAIVSYGADGVPGGEGNNADISEGLE